MTVIVVNDNHGYCGIGQFLLMVVVVVVVVIVLGAWW